MPTTDHGSSEESAMARIGIVVLIGLVCLGCRDESVEPPLVYPPPNSAGEKLLGATSVAEARSATASPTHVLSANVRVDGTSDLWQYKFRERVTPYREYYLHATPDTVVFDSISTLMTVGDAYITHSWCNSNEALVLAEFSGGAQFRTTHPHHTISASLGEAVVPDPKTTWVIIYRSTDDLDRSYCVAIDAASKSVLQRWGN